MPKVELNDVILYYSPLSQSIYAGVPDKREGKNAKGYGVALHKVDISASFWNVLVQRLQDDGGAPVELRINNRLIHTITIESE